jgi:hypothetical protein
MVSGGFPKDLKEEETAAFALRKANKQALKQLSLLAERKTISDFDTNIPLTPLEQAKQDEANKFGGGLILPKGKKNERKII